MRRADVAVVIPSLRVGGAQDAAVTLVRLLEQQGLDVDLVLFRAGGPFLDQVPERVNLVDLRAGRARRALPGLVRYLRRRRPVSLLASMDRTIVLTVIAARIAQVDTKVVGQVQNTMSKAAARGGWQDRLRPLLARLLYRKCSSVVAVSQGVARDLVALGVPEHIIEVVHNPIPVEDIATASASAAPPHPWFSDNGPPVVLGIGRLTEQKDFATLIRAFGRVRQRTPSRLVILGDGEDRASLERLVGEEGIDRDVDLPGFVDDPAPYLGRAAVFVLSSAWEGFGNVIVEALATGTPVVSTDCQSGPSEILERGRYGRLVPVGDPEAMAAAILDALSAEHDRDALRMRANAFAPGAILPRYLRVLGLER